MEQSIIFGSCRILGLAPVGLHIKKTAERCCVSRGNGLEEEDSFMFWLRSGRSLVTVTNPQLSFSGESHNLTVFTCGVSASVLPLTVKQRAPFSHFKAGSLVH